MMNQKAQLCLSVGIAALLTMANAIATETPLPTLVLAPQITVSGLSSGGYMAAQYHLAHAEQVSGAAIMAAGPVYCAQNSLATALGHCFNNPHSAPNMPAIEQYLLKQQHQANLATSKQLANDKVWILNGSADTTVLPKLGSLLAQQYQLFVPATNIELITDKAFAHTWPTDRAELGSCDKSESPFLANCHYDAAGNFLAFLLGEIKPKASQTNGQLMRFNQHQLSDAAAQSLAQTGYVYIPQQCATGARCRLHVSFHGCKQNAEFVEQAYVTNTDLNNYADSNNLVILYPQTTTSMVNPNACWDWWGYSGEDYATREGKQIIAVNEMIDSLMNNGRN